MDDFSLARSRKLVDLYQRYRSALDAGETGGRWMPYRWWTLPGPLGIIWLPYGEMLGDFASELANIINDLAHHVHRLRAWAEVIEPLGDDDRLEVTHEFVDVLGTVALGLPYAIKSRFTYAAAHLCHQANRSMDLGDWKDRFPDGNLYLNHIDDICRRWRTFRRFKLAVEPIAGNAFKDASDDFRNSYNHGFSPRLVLGLTRSASRMTSGSGAISYGIGGTPPLDLNAVADLLETERTLCYRAFERFQNLIDEQIRSIAAFERIAQAARPKGR